MSKDYKSVKDAYQKFKENPETGEEGLLKCVQNYKEAWFTERQSNYDSQWQNNLAFYSGNHWVRGRNANSSGANGQVRVRENHINNIISRIVSIVVQNLPIVRVFPNSLDYDDIMNAETTELYAKYFWRQKKMESLIAKRVKYTLIFGNSFMYRKFDPDLGGEVALGPSESGTGQSEIRQYRGDISLLVDDPFKWAVRPGIESLDDMYDIVRAGAVNKHMLEAKYGEIKADPITVYDAYSGSQRKDEDQIVLNEYFHIPTSWFEEGLYVCWAGNKILKVSTEYPYKDKKLPVTNLGFDKPPMRFWGMSTIDQVIDLQEQLNKAASMIIEARNMVARPRWLVSHEAQVPGQSMTDRAGDIIRYKQAGGPPQAFVPSFNFAEMQNHKADLRGAIDAVSGVSAAGRDEIPAAVRTALALQLVLEQNRSQYAPFIKEFHQIIQDDMLGILNQAAQFFPEEDPRVVKIEGAGYATSRAFHGGMVPAPLDVYLEDTNPLGWTAAGRAEQVQNLVQVGVLTDKNQILEMLKLNTPDAAYELVNVNRQAQQKEIELMQQGQFIEIGPADLHDVHLEQLNKVIASFSFRYLAPAVQDAMLAHRQQHMDAMQPPMPVGPDGQPMPQEMAAPADGSQVNTGNIEGDLSSGLETPSPGAALNDLIAK